MIRRGGGGESARYVLYKLFRVSSCYAWSEQKETTLQLYHGNAVGEQAIRSPECCVGSFLQYSVPLSVQHSKATLCCTACPCLTGLQQPYLCIQWQRNSFRAIKGLAEIHL